MERTYRSSANCAASTFSDTAGRLAIGASAAALGLLVSLHVLSPEYSPAWRMISEYADGPFGWVLSLMFIAYGASLLALAFAIRSELSTRRGKTGVALLTLAGLGAASAAQFDLNQAALHDLAGVLGVVCLPIAAMLISPALVARPAWRSGRKPILLAANLTWLAVVVFIASFVLMIATFMQILGNLPSTPPAELPRGVIAVVGWVNRLVVLSAWTWVSVVAWQGIKASSPRRVGAHLAHETVGP